MAEGVSDREKREWVEGQGRVEGREVVRGRESGGAAQHITRANMTVVKPKTGTHDFTEFPRSISPSV